MPNLVGLSYKELSALEVEWYERHGRYQTRIKTDSLGMRYVESDFFWNWHHLQANEIIKWQMGEYVAQKKTGLTA